MRRWIGAGCGLALFAWASFWWTTPPARQAPAPSRNPSAEPEPKTPEERTALWLRLEREYYSPWHAATKAQIVEKIHALAREGEPHAQKFLGMTTGAPNEPPASKPSNAAPAPAPGEGRAEKRYEPVYQTDYQGIHPDLFAREQDRVRLLLRQAQIEISSRLGLFQYREGFQCPLMVRFNDKPTAGVEHALAYVLIVPIAGRFAQMMVVNLDVMASYPKEDFDRVFYHEMTHAVLNDAVDSVYHRSLPSWVQEGLAVYIDGDGEARVKAAARSALESRAGTLVRDLEDPVLDYARNYLAFKFMVERQSINTLQTFVRDLTMGKTPEEAIENSTNLRWDAFRRAVRDYSAEVYSEYARRF
jgi:hypothetical protein